MFIFVLIALLVAMTASTILTVILERNQRESADPAGRGQGCGFAE